MCGIAGFQPLKPGAHLRLPDDRLRHRGPDSIGRFEDPHIQLLHHRLSIVDLSERANQPMANEDETLWLVFNGEIYNSPQIRMDLEAGGHRFRSDSDGEVLLHLYEDLGPSMLNRLRGMFAFAIYDALKKEIFLARDPLGIKPLFYTEIEGGFAFASELREIVDLRGFSRKMDWEAFFLYTRLNFIPAPLTIWRDARRLEPGHWLRVREGRIERNQSYFETRFEPWVGSSEEATNELGVILEESVRQHLLSDVPLGSFLSGGLDSSVVTALAQRSLEQPLQTFTVTFPSQEVYDESLYARAVANHLGTRHEEIAVSSSEAAESISEILEHLDEPFADSSLMAAAIVSKATRQHVKVALAGDGGDELFAGYSKYQGLRLAQSVHLLAPLFRAAARLPIPEHHGTLLGKRWRQVRRMAAIAAPTPFERYRRSTELVGGGLEDVLNARSRNVGGTLARAMLGGLWEEGEKQGYRNEDLWLYVDARFGLPYDMLHKVDIASMRYSLEVRVPFIDPKVFQFASRLPFDWKLKGHERKWILKQVALRHLTPELVNRPKQGFGFPIGEWIRGDLRSLFESVCSMRSLDETRIWDARSVQSLYREHISRRYDRYRELWNIIVFECWRRKWDPDMETSSFRMEHQYAGASTL